MKRRRSFEYLYIPKKSSNFSYKERSLLNLVRRSSPHPWSPVKSFINDSFSSKSTSSLTKSSSSKLTKMRLPSNSFITEPTMPSNILPAFKILLEHRAQSSAGLESKFKPAIISYHSVLKEIDEASRSVSASKDDLKQIRARIVSCHKIRDRLRRNRKRL